MILALVKSPFDDKYYIMEYLGYCCMCFPELREKVFETAIEGTQFLQGYAAGQSSFTAQCTDVSTGIVA